MYKLIAIDMDGTLLRHDKTISNRTKEAIAKARDKGVKVILASGRPIEGIHRYLEELEMTSEEDYVMSYNGSLIQKVKTKETISKNTLKGSDLAYLYDISQSVGVHIHAFSSLGCITPKMNEYSELEGRINGIPVLETDYSHVQMDEDIIKIMFVDPEEVLNEVIKKLPESLYEKYTIVRSAPHFLEFLNKKASKGTGVKKLAEHLNIKQEEIICIGDAGNDVDMIEFAGLGVAMGNAFEEVKNVADYITLSNEEDGVAHVIEKYIGVN